MKLLLIFIIINVIQRGAFESEEVSGEDTRIIGGTLVEDIKDYPFVASLVIKYGKGFQFQCGASIIAKRWAVTAAHCFYDFTHEKFYLGCNSIRWDGIKHRRVKKFHMHERYNKNTKDYDVALVHVAKRFPKKSIIRMVHSTYKYVTKTNATTLGWGLTDNDEQVARDYLSYVDITLQDWTKCRRRHRPRKVTERMFCAGLEGKDSCSGDSGGPIYQYSGRKRVLIGVVSWGSNVCAIEKYSGVYTNLAVVSGWIKQIIKKKKHHH